MKLIEVDGFRLQAAQTVFAFMANGLGAEFFSDFPLLIPAEAALGENVRPRAAPVLERSRNDCFGVAQAVNRGGVNPVDAQFQRSMNCRDRIFVVLRPPGKFPT